MAGRLVTVARFDLAGQAHLAKNALEAAGIKAVLTDEAVVAMDWFLSNAVGGIKVQVLEEDADRAVTVLEEALGSEEPLDEEALAAEAEAAAEADGEPPEPALTGPEPSPALATEPAASAHAEAEPPASERDEYTRRLVLAAFFGLVVPLLWFYAVYLFLNAVFGEGSLQPRNRIKLRVGGLLLAIGFFTAMYLIWLSRDPFP